MDGILLDLGVSSPQLERCGARFQFQVRRAARIRMDTSRGNDRGAMAGNCDEAEIREV